MNDGAVQPTTGGLLCPICDQPGTPDHPLLFLCGCNRGYHPECVILTIVTPAETAPNPCPYCNEDFRDDFGEVFTIASPFNPEVLRRISIYGTIWALSLWLSYNMHHKVFDFMSYATYLARFLALGANWYADNQLRPLSSQIDWWLPVEPGERIYTFRDYNPDTQLPEPGRRYLFDVRQERTAHRESSQTAARQIARNRLLEERIRADIALEFGIDDVYNITEDQLPASVEMRDQLYNRLIELERISKSIEEIQRVFPNLQ